MIIQTRYRDVPWEDVMSDFRLKERRVWRREWPRYRGRVIHIQPPSYETDNIGLSCHGPFYQVVNAAGQPVIRNDGLPVSVCPHICEIGD